MFVDDDDPLAETAGGDVIAHGHVGLRRQCPDLLAVGGRHARAEFDIFFHVFSNRSFKWVRASARNLGAGLPPARCIWQGSGFAADQTNAMLAFVRADDESLVPRRVR